MDKRVKRSRRLLGDALLNLLHTHELDNITVRAVTDAADVGYMTFYRHYDSLDDLLVDRIRLIIDEQIESVIRDCERQGELIFAHIRANAALYRTLLFSPGAARARRKLEQMLAEFFALTALDDGAIPVDLRSRLMAAGVLSLADWWFEHHLRVPVAEMASHYNQWVLAGNLDAAKVSALVMAAED